jgi:hypothetical protein
MASKKDNEELDLWNEDNIQFPRLLAEIVATQDIDVNALAESMDLDTDEVWALFSRAEKKFEIIKENLREGVIEVIPPK